MLDRFQRTLVRAALAAKGHALPVGIENDELLVRFHETFEALPIQAIKEFRAVAGIGLKEAKDEWDRIKPKAAEAFRVKNLHAVAAPDLKVQAQTDFAHIISDFRKGIDDEWTERSIVRVRNFLDSV